MDDHLAAQIGHWVWAILITGGGAGAIIAWWLTKGKKVDDMSLYAKASELLTHVENDVKAFDNIDKKIEKHDDHFEKQYQILLDISKDMGKIKGKLGVE